MIRHRGRSRPFSPYRYRLPASLSWAGAPGRLEIRLEHITTATGFSFAQAGWHPHVETLRWLDSRAERGHDEVQESPLARLYSAFQPSTVQEALFEDRNDPIPGLSDVSLVRGQLRDLWNPYSPRQSGSLDRPGLYWGPASHEHVETELQRTLALYTSLAERGLRDEGPGKDAIAGHLLVRGDQYRSMVHEGHHRLACLTALGHTDGVPVWLVPNHPPVVCEDDLGRWTNGAHPRYSPVSAQLLFQRLFESTGVEKASRLGLLSSPSRR